VSLKGARRQKTEQLELTFRSQGEALEARRSGEAPMAASGNERSGIDRLMEQVVDRKNMQLAWKRVKRNKGSPGNDGMTIEEAPEYLRGNWESTRAQLLGGTYQPKLILRREIAKRGGGVRQLGIPCVVDRLIQQAILQVLQPMFDPTFSEYSYGFRPGRRAHDAVCQAQKYIQEGRRVVVDLDLENFFDRANHDVLMGKLEKRIGDKRVLGLIRRYLEAGVMVNGVVMERHEGAPQGGPLSPILANVLLDEVDKELEKRGHTFVRYGDDCNVYMRSKRAGQRVMQALRRMYARLKLKVNEAKSAVGRPQDRKFLGFSFWQYRETIKRRVAPKALVAMKARVKQITRRSGGRSVVQVTQELRSYLTGWKQYFRLAETPYVFRDLDSWIRHRLRMIQLKQWKRGPTVYRKLRNRGVSEDVAAKAAARAKHWWRTSNHQALKIALPNSYYDQLGVPKLAA
jgi:group II intron reverse transcriptase/maturase